MDDDSRENILQHFDSIFDFIDQHRVDKGVVLVHCAAGVSRSAAVCIGYVMHTMGVPYEQALEHVQKRRQVINPNAGFHKQLQLFEQCDHNATEASNMFTHSLARSLPMSR